MFIPPPPIRAPPRNLLAPPHLASTHPHLAPQETTPDRLAVQLLRTCQQINAEGTAVLYSQNSFLIGHRIILSRRPPPTAPHRPYSNTAYHPMYFFLRSLRRTTIQHIKSITFARSCQCGACTSPPPHTPTP
ncbi:hypothetical protein B0T16DRAFT_89495 [Cercophora newfieldiana]|uniref:Uncharacterized protein n=1 Tax=Cercophora newfieldiana TaxID=92897 RepID=A0AA40CWL8_9PEZI|nr:hypothetical protein B0T16DRAFT_89495 [Cercophora newfieldiana]